jgi:hypothetical protein
LSAREKIQVHETAAVGLRMVFIFIRALVHLLDVAQARLGPIRSAGGRWPFVQSSIARTGATSPLQGLHLPDFTRLRSARALAGE